MIEDAEKAKQLARAICADVRLYNAVAMGAPIDQRGTLLRAPLQEGRQLFATRVSPRLAHVFEEAVAELFGQAMGAPPVAVPPAPRLDPPAAEGGSILPVLVVVAILVIAAAAVFLVR